MALAEKAFASSSQILIDQDLRGWKEIEYEVRISAACWWCRVLGGVFYMCAREGRACDVTHLLVF